MNANSKGRSQTATSRMTRGIGVAALSTILVAGLAGCMTGRTDDDGPVSLNRNPAAPAGVSLSQTADRMEAQLAQQSAQTNPYPGVPADRIAEQLARQSDGSAQSAPTNPYPGMPADRIEHLLQQ